MNSANEENPWGPIRSTLSENFSFGDIKNIIGYGNLNMSELSKLEQKPKNGATKSQLLSKVDEQIERMNGNRRIRFAVTCCEEMIRRKSGVKDELERIFSRVGWKFIENDLIPIKVLNSADLNSIPASAHRDIQKAAVRLRDGDLSGAISAACGALDNVTSEIYREHNLGKPTNSSFQERIKKSIGTVKIVNRLEYELTDIGWSKADYTQLSQNIEGSLNQAAFVMQKLRSAMGDVHGEKAVISTLAYDSIKWSLLMLRFLSNHKLP